MLSTLDAIRQRRSVRGFLPQPVPEPTLQAVFELAQRAPSNCNTQPWQVHVVQGDSALRLSQRLSSAALDPAQHAPDFPYDGRYEGEYRERQGDAAARLFAASAIARDDRAGRMRSFLRNYEFFGAPQAAFIFLPAAFGLREAADCGIYAQTLMLALTAHGLASCPQTALSLHAPLVREHLGLGPELKLLMGLSFGFEDPADPANACRIERAALPRAVTFHA